MLMGSKHLVVVIKILAKVIHIPLSVLIHLYGFAIKKSHNNKHLTKIVAPATFFKEEFQEC